MAAPPAIANGGMKFDPLEAACNGLAVFLAESAMSGSFSFSGRRQRTALYQAGANVAWQMGLDFGVSGLIPPTVPKEAAQGISQGVLVWGVEMVLPGEKSSFARNLMNGVIASYGGSLLTAQKKSMM